MRLSQAMFRLYTAANLPEAHLVLHRLQAAGIKAKVFNENAQGGLGELPVTYPEIWVEQATDVEKGRNIIREFEQSDVVATSRVCAQCGEENPANFEVCWQCGSPIANAG